MSSANPWFLISAIFLGAALHFFLATPKARQKKGEAKPRHYTLVYISSSLAVISAVVGFVLGSARVILSMPFVVAYFTCALVFFCAMRYKKTFGVVTFVFIALCTLLLALFLSTIIAFTGETTVAEVEILSVKPEAMELKVSRPGEDSVTISMEGEYFAPIVKVIIFNDMLVFLGARTWYRFVGITSFRVQVEESIPKFKQADTDYYFQRDEGISESLWKIFEKYEQKIPGVKTTQIEMNLKSANTGTKYSLNIQNDGGLQIVPESP